jgi:hypothetical protein
MFIKWRTYQRQLNGVKGDKYIQQPIIVKSYRLGKKKFKEMGFDIPEEAFDMPEFKKKLSRPRHEVILELPSYPVCMVIYYRSPNWMSQRFQWWENVDALLEKLIEVRENVTEEIVKKLKADIEKVVPRVTPAEVEQLKVVLNDLPLHL